MNIIPIADIHFELDYENRIKIEQYEKIFSMQ